MARGRAGWYSSAMSRLRSIWPLLLVLALLAAVFASGLQSEISWPAIAARQATLHALVAGHPLAMGASYVALYALVAALSLPIAPIMSAAGGLLFGIAVGAALAVTGATAGAVLLYLVASTALGPLLARRAAPVLDRIRPDLERHGFSTLLALRLVPLVPFVLLNLAATLAGMRLLPYTAATFIGIIPVTTVLVSIGAGLGDVLEAGGTPDLSMVLSVPVLLPLIGLAALSLAPMAWRRRRRPNP
jgi:uncharacterized membrane protein YdjX (TVP38/TMEM64 family)